MCIQYNAPPENVILKCHSLLCVPVFPWPSKSLQQLKFLQYCTYTGSLLENIVDYASMSGLQQNRQFIILCRPEITYIQCCNNIRFYCGEMLEGHSVQGSAYAVFEILCTSFLHTGLLVNHTDYTNCMVSGKMPADSQACIFYKTLALICYQVLLSPSALLHSVNVDPVKKKLSHKYVNY